MFNFLGFDMIGNYQARKVDRYKDGNLIIDTCLVTDGEKPFETAVQHPQYNNNEWVIVEAYDTKELAEEGHKKWVSIMTAKELPEKLVDCCNSMIGSLAEEFGCGIEFKKGNKK